MNNRATERSSRLLVACGHCGQEETGTSLDCLLGRFRGAAYTCTIAGRVLFLTLLSVLIADQVSKHVARRAFAVHRRHSSVAFRLVANPRPGLVRLHRSVALAIWAVAVAYSVIVVRLLDGSVIGGVAIGLAIGGATSNLVDRVTRGSVTDFVCLWRWPAFNLADAALVAAVPLAVCALL